MSFRVKLKMVMMKKCPWPDVCPVISLQGAMHFERRLGRKISTTKTAPSSLTFSLQGIAAIPAFFRRRHNLERKKKAQEIKAVHA